MRALAILFASVALVVGCQKPISKPDLAATGEPGDVPPVPHVRPDALPPPDFRGNVRELNHWVGSNPRKFAGQRVEVSGEVEYFDLSSDRPAGLRLDMPHDPAVHPDWSPIVCTTVADPWAMALPGQRVTVSGTLAREFVGLTIRLTGCRIIVPGKSVAIKETPQDMIRDAIASATDARAKYNGKWLWATGTVLTTRPDVDSVRVVLDVAGVPFELVTHNSYERTYAVGGNVTIAAKVSTVTADRVFLLDTFPVTKK